MTLQATYIFMFVIIMPGCGSSWSSSSEFLQTQELIDSKAQRDHLINGIDQPVAQSSQKSAEKAGDWNTDSFVSSSVSCDESIWQQITEFKLPAANQSSGQSWTTADPSKVEKDSENEAMSKMAELSILSQLASTDNKNQPFIDLWATYYFLPSFISSDEGISLLNSKGEELGPRLMLKQWCTAAMEGSVQIFFEEQWTTYNYAGSDKSNFVDCSAFFPHKVGGTRFRLARGSFGDGVGNYKLIPYRSIAVDQRKIPFGSLLYIPQARGNPVMLPDGQIVPHDGYFFAADTGGAILGEHIDVFIGRSEKNPFSWIGSKSSAIFKAVILNVHELSACFEKLHR